MKLPRCILALLLLLFTVPMVLAAEDAPIQPGDQVVIWLPDQGLALSSQRKNSYNTSVSVTLTDGVLTGYGDTELWTVEQGESGWRFVQNGQALSMTDTQKVLGLGGEHDCWSLEAEGDLFRIQNTGRGQYIRCVASRSWWDAAASGTKLALYVLPRAEEPTQPSETTAPAQHPEYGGKYLYFGQLHAHTDLSDGEGTVEEVFQSAAQVPGLDFFAVTDHSQNFDGWENASLTTDAAAYSEDWARGKAAAAGVTDGSFVGIFGFEMTWNQGQGHISTFATPGFLSREQAPYQSYAGGMEHYYAALLEAENSISQFNHPGSTYGDFKGFDCWSAALDQRITLIEVGEDLSQYDRALTAGWHLAPTNNQNTHTGSGGEASAARTVVLAAELTEQALYDAMANYRVYATQDADLQIYFTLNGWEMGSRISGREIGDTITLSTQICDPTDEAAGTVEVVTEQGLVLTQLSLSNPKESITVTLPANRSYYYLRITQPDGDWAVTAPIWLDRHEDFGIASLVPATDVTTAGEAQQLQLTLFNNEETPLSISAVTLAAEGMQYTAEAGMQIPAFGTAGFTFSHTFPIDGIFPVTASVTALWEGETRQFTLSVPITVMPPALVDHVIVDGTHGNDTSVANAAALAKNQDVGVRVETEAITEEMLENCRILIIPAPSVELEAEFMELVADFAETGGYVILCGTSAQTAPEGTDWLNGLLEELGSSLKLHSDEVRDDVHNGGSPEKLYTMAVSSSQWTADIIEGQRYSQYSGCSVSGGFPLVRGETSAYSTAGVEPVLLAGEETPSGGWIFAAGGLFLADDHIRSDADWGLPSANQTILETILNIAHTPQKVIPISQLRRAEVGRIYLAEGWVTAGTANPNTTFENTICIQDHTGGIAAAPYSLHGLALGTRVRILGALGSDGENPQLEILRLEIMEKDIPVSPESVDCAVTLEQKGGCLLQIQGTVVSRELTADGIGVSKFVIEDASGHRAAVLVEDTIRSGSRGKNELSRLVKPGNLVSAVGILHQSGEETVLRVRDCDEVHLLNSPDWTAPPTEEEDGSVEENETGDDGNGQTGETDPEGTSSGSDSTDPTGPGSSTGEENPNTGDAGLCSYALLMLLSGLALWRLEKKRI